MASQGAKASAGLILAIFREYSGIRNGMVQLEVLLGPQLIRLLVYCHIIYEAKT